MIKVDYDAYLNGQSAWAKILIDLAKTEDRQKSRDLTELAKDALNRTLTIERVINHDVA